MTTIAKAIAVTLPRTFTIPAPPIRTLATVLLAALMLALTVTATYPC